MARALFEYSRWQIKKNPILNRNVELNEIGNSALYLISDLSKAVTGEIHYVDCGFNIVGMPKS